MQGALAFQQTALNDYSQALEQFAGEQARKKFQTLDQTVWNFTNPKIGWSYFMNVSVVTPGNMESKTPVISYYNPWSDVFLLTAWKLDNSGPRIVDAEMVMGDFIRNKGEPPFSISPSWMRMKVFKPLAVGEATAMAIRAFKTAFSGKTNGNWRQAIPNLNDLSDPVMDLNNAGVSLLLASNLAEIDEVRKTQSGEDAQVAAMRTASIKTLELARAGKIRDVLKLASETIPATREALDQIAPQDFGSLRPVSFLMGKESSILFLIPTDGSGFFVSFLFKGKPNQPKLARIDLVDYAQMYALTPAS